MFLEEVEIVPGAFDQLLLSGVNRVFPQPVADCSLGCLNFVQQFDWVQLDYRIVIKGLPVAVLHFGPHFDDVPRSVAVSARQYNGNGLTRKLEIGRS
jgi:hypothetical protein